MVDHFYKVKDKTALANIVFQSKHSLKQWYEQSEVVLKEYTAFLQLNCMLWAASLLNLIIRDIGLILFLPTLVSFAQL